MTGGPLGKYSQVVAALVASAVIVSQLVVWVAQAFNIVQSSPEQLQAAFYIALGAVFGAAASTAVNGDKIEAAHKRLDILSAPQADSSNDPTNNHHP